MPLVAESRAVAGVAYSVIIVNWNVCDLLQDCLQSVRQAQRQHDRTVEIIVVDNASTDGSLDMLRSRFPDVTVIANTENVGFGRANNQAMAACTGAVIVLLNPDTVVPDGALDALVAHVQGTPGVGISGCRLLNGDRTFQRWTGGSFPTVARVLTWACGIGRILPGAPRSLFLERDVTEEQSVDWVSGACLAVRTEALGGQLFDPAYFMYGEDMELCHRVRQAGWDVRYVPAVSIVHYHGRSMAQQSDAVLLSALRGPRSFYIARHGRRWIWAYDASLAFGFALRWIGFSLLAPLRGSAATSHKARTNRDLMRRAVHLLRSE